MQQENNQQYVSNEPVDDGSNFDIRELMDIFLNYRYWFLASVIVCFCAAYTYLHFTTPIYQISSKVLVKDKEGQRGNSINQTFQNLGVANASNGFENELEILGTKNMNLLVVYELKLYTSYYVHGRVQMVEVYRNDAPYWADLDTMALDTLRSPIKITFNPGGEKGIAKIETDGFSEEKSLAKLPLNVSTPNGMVTIMRNPSVYLDPEYNSELICNINNVNAVALNYASKLSVAATSKTTTIACLTLNDNLPKRSVDYLKKLVDVYNNDANADNNEEANRTADFIEERLGAISKELNITEAELEQFKRNSGITDQQLDASNSVAQNMQYESKTVEVNTQLGLIQYLLEYVNDKHNYLAIIPSNVGLSDAALSGLISKYNEIVMERNRLMRSASASSPNVQVLTDEAENYFGSVKASLQSSLRQWVIRRNDLQAQQAKYTSRIASAPSKERTVADINRQQEVKAGLYIMLLEKREENLIKLASAAFKAKVVEDPIVSGPVSPKKQIILLASLLIGFLIPYGYIFAREFLRYRVSGREDLAKLCRVPLFGSVPFVKALASGNRTVVLQENRNSIMMEVYRSLRSNLPFVMEPGQKVILFTSCQSGEGKTCIASNLGASMAFAGKKVLLVGLDIRKPRLAGLFGLDDTDRGISNYLSRDKEDTGYLESVIQHTDISPNLDVLPAGTIPPNPAELLERENLAYGLNYLKQKYDFVLLDTAPVGLVSDTFSIAPCADLTLFVVRSNYTLKADLDLINILKDSERLANMNIILNGEKHVSSGYGYKRYHSYGYGYGGKRYGYGKGYGYSYGYGYGYTQGYGYGYGYGDKQQLEEV